MELSPAKRVEGFDDDDDDYDDRVECENQYCEESGRLIIKLNDDDGWTWSSENWKQSYDILLILILDFFFDTDGSGWSFTNYIFGDGL